MAAVVAACGALFSFLAGGFWSALLCQALIGVRLAGTYIPGMKALTDRLEGPWQAAAQPLQRDVRRRGSNSLILSGAVPTHSAGAPATSVGRAAGAIIVTRSAIDTPAAPHALLDFSVLHNAAVRPTCSPRSRTRGNCARRAWLVAFLTFAAGLQERPTRARFRGADGRAHYSARADCQRERQRVRVALRPRAHDDHRRDGVRDHNERHQFLAGSPWIALLVFAVVHVARRCRCRHHDCRRGERYAPAHRGATMALYSFSVRVRFISPAVFSAVLDLAGAVAAHGLGTRVCEPGRGAFWGHSGAAAGAAGGRTASSADNLTIGHKPG